MSNQKTVVFDFDGVIHSYKSGWQGVTNIPDEPVPRIKENIARLRNDGYRVVVVSTRCAEPEGMKAVCNYLEKHNIVVDDVYADKPPAICYVDDRALRFNGDADMMYRQVKKFKSYIELQKESSDNYTNKQITDSMIEELNDTLDTLGTVFRVKWFNKNIDNRFLQVVPKSYALIRTTSINISSECKEFFEGFFAQYGIRLKFNNDFSLFWAI